METLYETLKWVRANYASAPTKEINAKIDAALAQADRLSRLDDFIVEEILADPEPPSNS